MSMTEFVGCLPKARTRRRDRNRLQGVVGILVAWLVSSFCATGWCAASGPAHDFSKWEREISAFEQMDRTNPPPKKSLLFIGSSTIRFWTTLAGDFPQYRVINRGFGGSEIADSTHFAERIIFPYQPAVIFLRAGGNDIHNGKTPQQVLEDFKQFVTVVHKKLPQTEIVFISLFPTIARQEQIEKERELDELVVAYARNARRVRYLDVWDITLGPDKKPRPEVLMPDKLHLNEEGYKLLAARVRPCLP